MEAEERSIPITAGSKKDFDSIYNFYQGLPYESQKAIQSGSINASGNLVFVMESRGEKFSNCVYLPKSHTVVQISFEDGDLIVTAKCQTQNGFETVQYVFNKNPSPHQNIIFR